MGRSEVRLSTATGAEQVAALFVQELQDGGALKARLANRGKNTEFYTPKDLLIALEEDPPDLVQGAWVPQFRNAVQGAVSDIQIEIWDRGEQREVLIASEYRFTAASEPKRLIERVAKKLESFDASARRLGVES